MNVVLAVCVSAAIVVLFTMLFFRRLRAWRRFHDARARRELLMSFALVIVAWCGAMSALFSIAQFGTFDLRRTLGGIAWAALLAYGIVAVQDTKERHGRYDQSDPS